MQKNKLITALITIFFAISLNKPALADDGVSFDSSVDKLKEYALKATDFIQNIFSRDFDVPDKQNSVFQAYVPQQLSQQAASGDPDAQCKLGYIYSLTAENNDKALSLWQKAAAQGNSNAEYYLGHAAFTGNGINKNLSQAIKYWEKSAAKNNIPAQIALGEAYLKGKGVSKNPQKGSSLVQMAVNSTPQDDLAFFHIGRVYMKGIGLEKDTKKGISFIEKAARLGHPRAQTVLAYAYFSGQGVVRSNTTAMEWAQKASNQGDAWARILTGAARYHGEGVSSNKKEAAEIINSAISAKPNDPMTQGMIGLIYQQGIFNEAVPADKTKANKWFEQAANQENDSAKYWLAHNYYYGTGIAQDQAKAVSLLKQAADAGEIHAQLLLGIAYYYGNGINQDLDKAEALVKNALNQDPDDAHAIYLVGRLFYDGILVEKDLSRAANLFEMAALQGDIEAQFYLGLMYYSGEDFLKNAFSAVRWWENSANRGDVPSQLALGQMYYRKSGVMLDHTQEGVMLISKAILTNPADDMSQFLIGELYLSGIGLPADQEQGIRKLQDSARQGNPRAINELVRLGQNVSQDSFLSENYKAQETTIEQQEQIEEQLQVKSSKKTPKKKIRAKTSRKINSHTQAGKVKIKDYKPPMFPANPF